MARQYGNRDKRRKRRHMNSYGGGTKPTKCRPQSFISKMKVLPGASGMTWLRDFRVVNKTESFGNRSHLTAMHSCELNDAKLFVVSAIMTAPWIRARGHLPR